MWKASLLPFNDTLAMGSSGETVEGFQLEEKR